MRMTPSHPFDNPLVVGFMDNNTLGNINDVKQNTPETFPMGALSLRNNGQYSTDVGALSFESTRGSCNKSLDLSVFCLLSGF